MSGVLVALIELNLELIVPKRLPATRARSLHALPSAKLRLSFYHAGFREVYFNGAMRVVEVSHVLDVEREFKLRSVT